MEEDFNNEGLPLYDAAVQSAPTLSELAADPPNRHQHNHSHCHGHSHDEPDQSHGDDDTGGKPRPHRDVMLGRSYTTVARLGMFFLQANHRVSHLLQRSQLIQSGNLSDAVMSLTRVPRSILEQDVAILGRTDDYDNGTTAFGPDDNGIVYEINHTRSLNWWLRHDVQASATMRHAGPSGAARSCGAAASIEDNGAVVEGL